MLLHVLVPAVNALFYCVGRNTLTDGPKGLLYAEKGSYR